jgi:hypothetical protein
MNRAGVFTPARFCVFDILAWKCGQLVTDRYGSSVAVTVSWAKVCMVIRHNFEK